jgi:hypothetical protein
MSKQNDLTIDRRGVLKTSAAMLGGAFVGTNAEADPEPQFRNVNTNSSPSSLKITDLRVATVVKPGPGPCTIIRIDTNQGVYGLGEVRDGASPTYALLLKSRILGENPLRIDYLFRKIKQFGAPARQAGGVVSIEMALWDIAGKVYGVPIYQMLGGKFRDKVRIYSDTTDRVEGPQGLRSEHENSQGRNGLDVAEDGSGNRHDPRHPRHRDSAFGIERLGGHISPSPVCGNRGDR